jgi:hypothetical protein
MTGQAGRSLNDVQLDRLVDGELGESEYRTILEALDKEPRAWKRCALAFLEAQALRREFQALCTPGRAQPVDPAPTPRRYRVWSHVAAMLLTSAATLLVAFGWMQSKTFQPETISDRKVPRLVNMPVETALAAPAATNQGAYSAPTLVAASETNAAPIAPLGKIKIIEGGDTEARREIELPVFSVDQQTAATLLESESPVPWEIEKALRNLGYEVRRDRRWAPVAAGEHEVFVPLEQVDIKPIAHRAY